MHATYFCTCLPQEFDFVFDIELDEAGPSMRKLKLPYNKESMSYELCTFLCQVRVHVYLF